MVELIILVIYIPLVFISYKLMRYVWSNVYSFKTNRYDCMFFIIMSSFAFWMIIPWFSITVLFHITKLGNKISAWMSKEV